jgi:transketolase
MRTAFIDQLVEEAKTNDKIFLIVGDLGFSVVEKFRDQFPDRFLNVGIDEQNMVGVAVGLSMQGYNVYIYSIANFPTLRCMEQIRYDVAYHNANVKIVSVGAGFAYGSLGASHHATEDLGMMRIIPNMIVSSPGDPIEAKAITKFSANYAGPMYLRLGKAGEPVVHTSEIKVNIGDILTIIENNQSDVAVFATGGILNYAYTYLNNNHISSSLYSFPFIKPIDKDKLYNISSRYKKIITLEEHQSSGGFGSAITELLIDGVAEGNIKDIPIIKRIAIHDCFYSISGDQKYLRERAGLVLSNELFDE